MSFTIRRAVRSDFPTLFSLIVCLAEFEKLPPPDAGAQARLLQDGWPVDGSAPRFEVWLAEPGDASGAVAYAIVFETYSSFLAQPTLYLEDLFVLPAMRRRGIGRAMLEALVAEAARRGCGRVEWVVLDWNTEAQRFYERFGARRLCEWQTYRVTLPPARGDDPAS